MVEVKLAPFVALRRSSSTYMNNKYLTEEINQWKPKIFDKKFIVKSKTLIRKYI